MNYSILLLAVLIAYALGGIPSGLLIARIKSDVDLRSIGSGNIGSTNVYRAMGLEWAVAVFALDALKGFIPALIARGLTLPPWGVAIACIAAVIGHIASPYLRFKGGKGVATAFGVMLGIAPLAALLALVVWAGVSAYTKLISLGSLAAAAALPFATLLFTPHLAYRIGAFIISGLVFIAHRENIARIRRGEEKPIRRSSKDEPAGK